MGPTTGSDAMVWWPVLWMLESMLIIIANTTAIAVFHSDGFRFRKSIYLLLSLTVSDLLVGLSLFAQAVVELSGRESRVAGVILNGSTSVYQLSIMASIGSFTAISLERTYGVFFPFKHRTLEPKNYTVCVVTPWLIAGCLEGCYYIPPDALNQEKLDATISLLKIIYVSLCFIVMVLSYTAIWIKMKFSKPLGQNGNLTRKNAKLAWTLFTVTLVSVLCMTPIGVQQIYEQLCGCDVDHDVTNFLLMMMNANSFINVVVYSYKIPEFRQQFNAVISNYVYCCCHCRKRVATVSLECPPTRAVPANTRGETKSSASTSQRSGFKMSEVGNLGPERGALPSECCVEPGNSGHSSPTITPGEERSAELQPQ
ncbi:predicted protein [Nematostella vectensis]|uniref:G-protein coupled receptors family 1 profile domain-containing protein n=1 Tax=Nematostella vectensis TaxID=45351 RepID=A7RKN5_NEMVE|nr:predicted protein [Nematostella vectensis]|eukprot:XP_001640002.1 predicted protein [Nematostella vectensis]